MARDIRKGRAALPHRARAFRTPLNNFYVFCNGETEQNYVASLCNDLRLQSRGRVISKRHNRLSLVTHVEELLANPRCDLYDHDADTHFFIVFDVDSMAKGDESNPAELRRQTDEACRKCTKLGYTAIVSNECFELWVLLHYKNLNADSPVRRDVLLERVESSIPGYNKAKTDVYSIVRERTADATKRAVQLETAYDARTPLSKRNPYTNMHQLIAALATIAAHDHASRQSRPPGQHGA